MIPLVNMIALVAIMLTMGMGVEFKAVMASVQPVRLIVLGLVANYVLVPAITLGLLRLFDADPLVSVGFLILAVCPGAPIGPPATALARGNVPWALGMMLILAALSAAISPGLLSALVARIAPESGLHVSYLKIVRTLLIAQMLPLLAGLTIHWLKPRLTERIVRPLGALGNVLLLVLIGLIVATQFETLAAIRLRGWLGMGLLLLSSLSLGWICGGPDVAVRKASAITMTARNAAVGLVIVTNNFAGTPAVTAVVAYGLVSIVATLGCGLLFGKFAASENIDIRAA